MHYCSSHDCPQRCAAEHRAARLWLARFLGLFHGIPITAVGRHALAALGVSEVKAPGLRHPAHGGAKALAAGLRPLLSGD